MIKPSLAEYVMEAHDDSSVFPKWKYIKEKGVLDSDDRLLVQQFCKHNHTFRDVLQSINQYVNNNYTYYLDDEDKWLTPMDFSIAHGGDCEDFAIMKFFMAKVAAKEKEQTNGDKCIMMVIGKQGYAQVMHAVLLVDTRFGYYMLDSAEDKIHPISNVYWFRPHYGLCWDHWVTFQPPGLFNDAT